MYGMCLVLKNYSVTEVLRVSFHQNILVFFTDRNFHTYPTIASYSETEDITKLQLETGGEYKFVIQYSQIDMNDPTANEDKCKVYDDEDSYDGCVDDQIQTIFMPHIGCNPPWLSPRNVE